MEASAGDAAPSPARAVRPGGGLSPAGDVPYPRANPSDTARLPADIWHAATVPVGVRLELVGDAEAIDIAYRTTSGNLGYRGDGAGITFSVWRGGRKVCEEEAVLGDGLVRLALGASAPDKPAIIYLPEGMQPLVQSLTAVKGGIARRRTCPGGSPTAMRSPRGGSPPARLRVGRPSRPARPGSTWSTWAYAGAGTGRDRLRRAHRRPAGRDHLHRLRRELLEPGAAQRRHGGRRVPGLPRRDPPGPPHHPDRGGQPVPAAGCRGGTQQVGRHTGQHPQCHRVGDPRPDGLGAT